MAICHISASVVKRSAGHSAVAAAAYRAGEKLADERADKVHDYSRRRGVDAAEILAPPGAPAWALNRETLWNRVEAAEQRADSQVAREIRVAIPIELSRDAGRDLVRDYVQREFVDRGMVADVAWHDEGGRNPHAHILLTMRQIDRTTSARRSASGTTRKTSPGGGRHGPTPPTRRSRCTATPSGSTTGPSRPSASTPRPAGTTRPRSGSTGRRPCTAERS